MLSPLLHWISDVIWPASCLRCRTPGVRLCRQCLDAVPAAAPSHLNALPVIAAGHMRDRTLSRAIWYLKYRNATELAEPLGDVLATALGRSGIAADLLIPIPLHPRRLRDRGYNQAELLARRMASVQGIPYANALQRTRNTKSQVAVRNRTDRLENLSDAFAVSDHNSIRSASVVLVDDVTTTGATLSAAVHALQNAGVRVVGAATVARG